MMQQIICLLAISLCIVEGRNDGVAVTDDSVFERRLKLINKSPISTIELDYAIFDCIDIYEQPAFDHPLLKNHKIQLKPPRIQNGKGRRKPLHRSIEFGLSPGCPSGTVPIRRTTKEDLIREQSIGEIQDYFFYPNNGSISDKMTQFATLSIDKKDMYFTGAEALVNIQQPHVDLGAASGAQLWLFNNPNTSGVITAGVSAGWFVDSQFYGDGRPYYTAYWVGADGGGCFNVRCSGFVQIDQANPLGFLLPNVSKYGGPLVDMRTRIYQDHETKSWWLMAGDNGVKIGYWPKELFHDDFNYGADNLHFGGVVRSAAPNQLSPPMGSGISEFCHYAHTAYFSNIWYLHDGGDTVTLPSDDNTTAFANCQNYRVFHSCYPTGQDHRDYYFLYGGPASNCTT